MLNVSDNNMYEAQIYTLFYYSTNKCTGGWRCGSTPKRPPKYRLPDQEGLWRTKYLPVL